MGILFSAICCCTSCAVTSASCCCTATKGANAMGRQAAKGAYVSLLGTGVLLAWVGQRFFEDLNFEVAELDFKCDGSDGDDVCSDDGFVYRVTFMMAVFFAAMLLGNIPVPTLRGEQRWAPLLGNGFQNGCWALKILLFFGLLGTSLALPSSFFDNNDNTWAWACRILSAVFLVLQVFLLIDFGYQWNEDWVARADDDGGSNGWLIGVLVCSFVFYALTIAGLVGLFVIYSDCSQSVTYIVITLVAFVIMTVLTVWREKIIGEPGAVLPTSIVGLYMTFLCWTAIESIPDPACRPFDDGSDLVAFMGFAFAAITLVWASYTASRRFSNMVAGSSDDSPVKDDPSSRGLYAVGVDDKGREILARDTEAPRETAEVEDSNPNNALEDKAWLFHVFMLTGSAYSAMLLTNWGVEDAVEGTEITNDSVGVTSMWVKLVCQWLTMVLYLWTLVAPRILAGREFD